MSQAIEADTPEQALALALAFGRDRLLAEAARQGTEVPELQREVRLLLSVALDVDAGELRKTDATGFSAEVMDRFARLIGRRAAGEPMSHLRGWRDFWRLRFKVSPDVLDPRPETEMLVDVALKAPFSRVLDLGTGSGCIIISLLAERPEATGVGTDVSPEAVLVAGKNAAIHNVADRLILPLSEWYDDIGGRFDLIVSNPPYIAAEEMAGLSRDVRAFEPEIALTDGADGLSAYRAIAQGARHHLKREGRLLVEIGP
ncbi:MAG: peptide chain release factor N(5)-glutamine methyltransferase, partial [Pseudomonadota bacterium]